MSSPANSINETTTGISGFTGTAFVGTPVTQYNILTGAATSSALNNVAPSATSGVPVISQGAAAQPIFGTAVVAGGGTGAVTLTGVLTGNGTGAITGNAITQYAVVIGGATNAVASTAVGNAGQILQSSGAGVNPAFSTATYPAVATGTGTILRADGTNWVATTSTYPNTNAVSTLLYASATNVMSALATANNGVHVTSATGVPSVLAGPGTTGNIFQSNAAAAPSFSTATYPSATVGTGKVLYDNGTNFVTSVPTFPASASETTRKIIVSDGTNWVASTETWAVPGSSGNVLTSDGTIWTSAAPSSPTNIGGLGRLYLYDDFESGNSSNNGPYGNTQIPGSAAPSGGTTTIPTAQSGHPGIVSLNAVSNNFGMIVGPSGGIAAGGGTITLQWVCNLPVLSTGTNRYTARIGFSNLFNTLSEPSKGAWFEYNDNVNSGNWTINSAGAATTTANTSTAADTNWHNFKIIINAGNTSIAFYIDNVQVGNSPIITNLPNAEFGQQLSIIRGLGAGGSLYVDMYTLQIDLTTPRPG